MDLLVNPVNSVSFQASKVLLDKMSDGDSSLRRLSGLQQRWRDNLPLDVPVPPGPLGAG